jgi:hypothetical protein
VVDARRHEHGVHRLEVLDLSAGAQPRPALDNNVELVRATVLTSRLLLLRLQADQLGNEPRPVEDVDPDRPLTQEPAGTGKVDYIHRV